ncbi:thioredoxin family protein [Actinomadura madurae]|uniref:thioredoxin family protein n=1 Tax=Actinomadura madurae TaxID=1993 RepID=UPI00202681EE|nr:thioredoxin family protein [Actinomadura madurae]MCP9966186.1 thioredoxin family protein [Actinomadura madurae]MCP9978678.1 thioredoxin family protein [Actinomadura madurae]MCQ0009801.1 thioredoxin family protein [Actinomadura madurae]URM94978.1 thioredoxin family protein [Actinomadura madurae]URN05698.1 thioredoxin family protein [Actinomadura madurae]
MAIASFMVPLGSPVPAFKLPSVGGEAVAAGDFADASALLVVFLSNHCPYVRRIEAGLGALTTEYAERGLATVAVCSNDVANYPDDDADHLREQAGRAGFRFPYLVDASQETAKAFRAACTPDFFLYGRERTLAYRGEFDGARPGNQVEVDGASLRTALDLVLAGEDVPEPHTPSVGCGIKWKPGNDPA